MESRQPRVLVVDDEQHIVDFVEPAGRRGNLLGLLDRTTSRGWILFPPSG